jgi:hypothetical protein
MEHTRPSTPEDKGKSDNANMTQWIVINEKQLTEINLVLASLLHDTPLFPIQNPGNAPGRATPLIRVSVE